jgi:hypothetical protein
LLLVFLLKIAAILVIVCAIVHSTIVVVQEACLGRDPVFEANWMMNHPMMTTLSLHRLLKLPKHS